MNILERYKKKYFNLGYSILTIRDVFKGKNNHISGEMITKFFNMEREIMHDIYIYVSF